MPGIEHCPPAVLGTPLRQDPGISATPSPWVSPSPSPLASSVPPSVPQTDRPKTDVSGSCWSCWRQNEEREQQNTSKTISNGERCNMVSVETPHRLSLAILNFHPASRQPIRPHPTSVTPLGAINPIRQAAPLLRPPAPSYHKPLRQTRFRRTETRQSAQTDTFSSLCVRLSRSWRCDHPTPSAAPVIGNGSL